MRQHLPFGRSEMGGRALDDLVAAELAVTGLATLEIDWQREPRNDFEAAVPPSDALTQGRRVSLRRAQPADAPRAWRWLARSDLTSRRLGPPLFPDHPAPSYGAFCNDYAPHFFDGSQPYEGRAFVIRSLIDGRDVGFIVHERLDLLADVACLDLWLADIDATGRGYGSEAIGLLCTWLQAQRGINRFLLRPSRRNVRALRALRRAGFRETDLPAMQVVDRLALPRGEYADEVLLFRMLPPPQPLAPGPGGRVWLDTEFTRLVQPQLLSLGAVADDGAEFYAEIADPPEAPAGEALPARCSAFVREVVLPLLRGPARPRAQVALEFGRWLGQRTAPVTIVTDSGFDRWALADLLQGEDLPAHVHWHRVPITSEALDEAAAQLGLRRHHALDDARALRAAE